MIASDFKRDDCQLGRRRIPYAQLERDYRCSDCGGRVTIKWNVSLRWYPCCAACGGGDFIHRREYQQQISEALEVLDGLPPELAEALGQRHEQPLPLEEARALLHPPIVEI